MLKRNAFATGAVVILAHMLKHLASGCGTMHLRHILIIFVSLAAGPIHSCAEPRTAVFVSACRRHDRGGCIRSLSQCLPAKDQQQGKDSHDNEDVAF